MMIVLGLLFFVPGFVIAAAAIFSWLTAKLYGSLGKQTKMYVRRTFGVLVIGWIAWSSISSAIRPTVVSITELEQISATLGEQAAERDRVIAARIPRPEIAKLAAQVIEGLPDVHEQFSATPFSVQTGPEKYRFAEFRSGPGAQCNLLVLPEHAETVEILAVTDVQQGSFLWHHVGTGAIMQGYLLGERLCAKKNWIAGIQHSCRVLWISNAGNALNLKTSMRPFLV